MADEVHLAPGMSAHVLAIRSEAHVPSLLASESLAIECVDDAGSGFTRAVTGNFDLIILGAVLPAKTAFAICRNLRQIGKDMALLILTSTSRVEDRIAALRLGADDCIPACCDGRELVARVEALLRRVPKPRRTCAPRFCFDDVAIDFETGEVSKAGTPVMMCGKELSLLRYLISHRDRVVSRAELMRNVWDYNLGISRTIDVHIGWLRQKLEHDPRNPRHLMTIRGMGYRFD